ncbi:MAG TPA: tripartite tricarboxylate transporter substrate binding protein, partial [Thiobacillaceae bacterium]
KGRMFMRIVAGVLGAVLALAAMPAQSQDFPTKPVRILVPFAPGGVVDVAARIVGQKLAEKWGQQVLVENRPGGNGFIATTAAAKAAPDGYTLLMGNSGPMTVNPVLYRKVPYDPIRDFAPVTQGTSYMYVLVVPPTMPVKTLGDFVGELKSKPGQLTYGSTGIGGGNHLSGELFNLMTRTRAIHVPYTGSALALAALLGGQISYMFDTVITAAPQLQAGRLQAIGVTGARRASALPEVPTLDELGLKGYELTQWQAVVAPGGTPRPVIDRLHREVVRALKMPDVVDRLATQGGTELVGNTPEEFAQVIRGDLAKFAKLVKAANIEPR